MITVYRSPDTFKSSAWRPADFTVEDRRVMDEVRRVVPPSNNPKYVNSKDVRTISRTAAKPTDIMDYLVDGISKAYTPARIERVYHRGEFEEGYVFVRSRMAFAHEEMVAAVESRHVSVGVGAIIAKNVVLDGQSSIGAFAEVEKRAQVINSTVGDHTVVRKGTRLEDTTVGNRGFVDRFSSYRNTEIGDFTELYDRVSVPNGGEVGQMSRIRPRVTIEALGKVGSDVELGERGFVDIGATVHDRAIIDYMSYIGPGATVGENTRAGFMFWVGGGAIVGQDGHYGNLVSINPNTIVAAETIGLDGTTFSGSNHTLPKW